MRDLRDVPSLTTGQRTLLLAALFGHAPPPADLRLRSRLLAVADAYAVGPALRAAWNDAGAHHDIADSFAGDVATQMPLIADLEAAVAVLNRHDVRSVVLKGGALIAARYVAPGARHTHDFDLWIDPAAWARAEIALDAAGFAVDPEFLRPGVDGRTRADLRWADLHSGVPRIAPFGTPCDLHRTVPGLNPHRWTFDRVWARGRDAQIGDAVVRIPAPDDLLVALCDHVLVRHPLDPRLYLRHLCDLAALDRVHPLETVVGDAACSASERAAVELSVVLLRAAQRRDRRFVTTLGRILLAPPPAVAKAADVAAHWTESASALAYDAAHRPGLVVRRFFPHPDWMTEHYGVPRGSTVRLASAYVRRLATLPLRPLIDARS